MTAKGFAAVLDNEILVATVHDTERGAKVNAILVCYNVRVTAEWSDSHIEKVWEQFLGVALNNGRVLHIIPVTIARTVQ